MSQQIDPTLFNHLVFYLQKQKDFSKEDWNEFGHLLQERLKDPLNHVTFLGSGAYGVVYWLSDHKRVLKITNDEMDAYASAIVLKKPSKNLIKVYDVFQFGGPLFNSTWAIVSEKLTPLSFRQEEIWLSVWHLKNGDYHDAFMGSGPAPWKGLTTAWVDEVDKWLQDVDPRRPGVSSYKALVEALPDLKAWAKELSKRGILWTDLKRDNIMNRNKRSVIVDLGFGKVSRHPSIPKISFDY